MIRQCKAWTVSEIVIITALVGLFVLGLYGAYRTYVTAGGIWGWLAFTGRIVAELGLVLAASVATIALFAIVHVGVSIITGTKLRCVRIFISFKHDYESIVTELEKGLTDRDIEVVRLPFRRRDHDDVIGESFKAVRSADGVVVVPELESSWLNNELSIAVDRRKPIAVIKHLPEQPLSNSLYRGYPVFTWDKLQPNRFGSLRRFLNFATKSRGDRCPQFQRILSGLSEFIAKSVVIWFLVHVVISGVIETLAAFAPRKAEAVC